MLPSYTMTFFFLITLHSDLHIFSISLRKFLMMFFNASNFIQDLDAFVHLFRRPFSHILSFHLSVSLFYCLNKEMTLRINFQFKQIHTKVRCMYHFESSLSGLRGLKTSLNQEKQISSFIHALWKFGRDSRYDCPSIVSCRSRSINSIQSRSCSEVFLMA